MLHADARRPCGSPGWKHEESFSHTDAACGAHTRVATHLCGDTRSPERFIQISKVSFGPHLTSWRTRPMPTKSDAIPAGITVRTEPVQQRSSERITALLDAAAELIDRNGIDGLTTSDVAARSGSSVGVVYRYFPNIQSLLRALAARNMEKFTTSIYELMAEEPGQWLDALERDHRRLRRTEPLRAGIPCAALRRRDRRALPAPRPQQQQRARRTRSRTCSSSATGSSRPKSSASTSR